MRVEAFAPGSGWEQPDPTWDSAETAPLDRVTSAFEGSCERLVLDHRPEVSLPSYQALIGE